MIMIFALAVSAEFFQYTDENGNLIFTDDLSRIPVNQRDKITRFNSARTMDNPPDGIIDNPLQEKLLEEMIPAKKEDFEREFSRLQQARETLMEEKEKVTTVAEQQAYNEKVFLLNQQIERFLQQMHNFNNPVSGGNMSE
jgi:hypothetical protein